MTSPAGEYKNYSYQTLNDYEVDQIDNFSAFPEPVKLSRMLDRCRPTGHTASAKLAMANQPTDADELTIGSDVYMFLDAESTSLDDSAKIAVLIGATAADTRDNLIAAINATDDDNEHDSLFVGGNEDAPALANGTESIYADEVGTNVRIRHADGPGGTVLVGTQSLALGESITHASDVWNQANLSATGRATIPKIAHGTVTIDSTNLATDFNIELPFAPSQVFWEAYDSTYTKKVTTAILTCTSNSVLVNANAGASPLIATDIIQWHVIGF